MLKKMNIRTKFLLAFLVMSTIPFGLIGLISLVNSSRALSITAFGQLESIREVKKARIKFFFDERKADMKNIMQTAAILRQAASEKLSTVQEIKKAQVEEYFQKSMADLSVISKNSAVARALGDFASVFDEEGDFDEGLYNFFETVKYGDFLRQFKNEYGYHDLMLITKHGRIVYTLNKEKDLGQNVASGDLKNSALDRYFQKELNKPTLYDFELYAPSGNKYMSFICAPIIQYSETVGVIALKLDKKDVNTIAQRRKGMGETGETFLAGKSHGKISYRSDQVVGQGKIGEYISDNHIERALSGNPGSVVKKGSTDDMEIVRYDPLNIPGLNWAMVSTMSLEEVIAPSLEGEQEDYFAKYIRNYGYNDLFLIHPGGDVFYSVSHKADYGSNVLDGEFAGSGLGKLVRKLLQSGKFGFVDFQPYAPSNGKPAAFIGQPVVSNGGIEMIVAMQMPIDVLNSVMQERSGMGKTGETYLVGADKLMRSDSYLDPENYSVRASFAHPEKGSVNTKASEESFKGRTGQNIIRNYNNRQVLSAYTPVNIWDTTWALIAEIDKSEALGAVTSLKLFMAVLAIATIVIIVAVSLVIARHFAAPIINLTAGAEQLRIRNFDITIDVRTNDEFELLADTFNSMVVEIRDYAHNLEHKVEERTAQLNNANEEITALNERLKAENLRLGAELDVARRLQQMILPSSEELQHIEGLDIVGFMKPADEVGGDYYDVLHYKGATKISIGDVTGHGLESGVLMLMTQTAIRTLLLSGEADPVRFLSILNKVIYANAKRIQVDKSLTLSLLDYKDGHVKLSGQHEEMIVVRKGGMIELVDTIDLGFPLGLEENISNFVDETVVKLHPGDGVVLYSDGITEAENTDGELYGLERLCKVISKNWKYAAKDINSAVVEDVNRHIGKQKVFDDLTLVVLKQQ